jgi:UDP-N-acetylmuramate dehydrogenase
MNNIRKLGFGYRKSPFMKRKVIIISCEFELKEDSSSIKLYYDYLEKKKKTQPLKEKSAGSTFKNPNNLYAWKLINETNTIRKINDAEISSIHSNFFINNNNASFNDMRELIMRVQEDVFNTHHISLELELNIIE